MKSHTSLVAQQTCLSEWADLIRDCQNRPQGMKIDKWCQLHDITKASYYWRLRKVYEVYLETVNHMQTFVEVLSSAIHPVIWHRSIKSLPWSEAETTSLWKAPSRHLIHFCKHFWECSAMLNDGIGLKKCIWNVDLQVCAEELTV